MHFFSKTVIMFKIKNFQALIVLIALPAYIHAQTVVSGKITDAVSGSPLVGAAVYIPDLKLGAVSGRDGIYLIRYLPPGAYVVSISMIGYAAQAEEVAVKGVTNR